MSPVVRWFVRLLERRQVRRTIRRLRALERRDGLYVMAIATAGKLCKVVVGAATVAEMGEWDYTPSADLIEKTAFLATSKTHVQGLNDGTGSFKGRHDMTDTNGQLALRNAMVAGTQVTLKLYVTATNFYTVPALIKAMPIKAAALGLVDIQIDFQRDGDDSYT